MIRIIYPHRIYKDRKQNIYHSVTHILKKPHPRNKKRCFGTMDWTWSGSADERDMVLRGRLAHAHAEYLLKTGAKLARHNANKLEVFGEQER